MQNISEPTLPVKPTSISRLDPVEMTAFEQVFNLEPGEVLNFENLPPLSLSDDPLESIGPLDLDRQKSEIKVSSSLKRRRNFGRSASEVRQLREKLVSNLSAYKPDESELDAFKDMKTFGNWAPVSILDLLELAVEGDWILYSKPRFKGETHSERRRVVCKITSTDSTSIHFSTVSKATLDPAYSWHFEWDPEACDEEVETTISGRGSRKYYMRIPSELSAYPKRRPKKKQKKSEFICSKCGACESQTPSTPTISE